ncbi:hypothetical protein FRB91_002120 [Serendipita sp. 411]|nr:hypothetical protein FRB91_002120 [Serendipita sp. 411]
MHVLTLLLSLLSYLLIASAYHTTSYNASSPSLLYTPSNLWHADEIPSGDNCSHWLIYHWADDFASITLSFEGVAFDLYVYSWTVGGNYTLQIDDEEPTQVSGRTLDGACVPPYSKGNLTYTTHNVTLNLYGSLVGYTVTVPDPGDEPSTPSASTQSDKAKRKLVIIAAACGAGGGFLIALFFVCCCCCCNDNKSKKQKNKLQKQPVSTYTYASTAPTPVTPRVQSVPATASTTRTYHTPGDSTVISPDPWSSSKSVLSAAPSTQTRTTTTTRNSTRPLTIATDTFGAEPVLLTPTKPQYVYRKSLPPSASASGPGLAQPPSILSTITGVPKYGDRQSLPPTASTQWSSLRSSMLSQTEWPQQQQPPPQYQPGLLGSLLSQTESNVKVQTKGKGPATEKARAEPEAESELERGTKKLSWMDRYPIGSPVSMLSVPPPAANPVRNAIPNIRHSNPTAPITRAPDWENSGEALD